MNILITGASRGIGRAVAIEFAKNKHNIIICAKSDHEGLQNTKHLVENENVSCYTDLCDVTNEDGSLTANYSLYKPQTLIKTGFQSYFFVNLFVILCSYL